MGITPEFIWYEATVIRNDINSSIALNMSRFDRLVTVMESRYKDTNKMLEQVMSDNKNLQRENKALMAMLDAKTQPGA